MVTARFAMQTDCLFAFGFLLFFFKNVCLFDYMTVVVSGEVGYPLIGLTTPVGLLFSLQLTVLSRSAIVV